MNISVTMWLKIALILDILTQSWDTRSIFGGYRNTGYGYSSLNKLTSGVNNIGLGIYGI